MGFKLICLNKSVAGLVQLLLAGIFVYTGIRLEKYSLCCAESSAKRSSQRYVRSLQQYLEENCDHVKLARSVYEVTKYIFYGIQTQGHSLTQHFKRKD